MTSLNHIHEPEERAGQFPPLDGTQPGSALRQPHVRDRDDRGGGRHGQDPRASRPPDRAAEPPSGSSASVGAGLFDAPGLTAPSPGDGAPGRGVPGDRPGRPRLGTPGLPSAKILLTGSLSASYMRLRREAAGGEALMGRAPPRRPLPTKADSVNGGLRADYAPYMGEGPRGPSLSRLDDLTGG
jgi:hypothetical protein